jgi:hypothetical protein
MKGLTDAEFERLYGTEDQCLAALVIARQQAGMPCPICKNPKSYVYGRRVGCAGCDVRWSITLGTVMADTKLPLTVWFRAMHLMSGTKQGISVFGLGRRLGVSYPTAWYLHKRLRHAMTERGDHYRLGEPDNSGSALWWKWTTSIPAANPTRAVAPPAGPASLPPANAIQAAAWAMSPYRWSAVSPARRWGGEIASSGYCIRLITLASVASSGTT